MESISSPQKSSYGGGLFVLTGATKPGTLVGIDKQYYNVAYPFNVITYGVFPVLTPKDSEVAGMKLSTTLNCVAQQVIKHFKESKRGAGLTETRANKIAAWSERVNKKNTVATKHDVAELEKKVKSSNCCKDASR